MNTTPNTTKTNTMEQARESFSGRLLTNRQFDEAIGLTRIIEAEIHKTGAFKEKLGDYAHALARTERFDAVKAETILRDLFKERTGQTMNQIREGLVEAQEKLTDEQRQGGYQYAAGIGEVMENGVKVSFNRAVAQQSQAMAADLGITDNAARSIMAEEFEAVESQSLWDWGKQLDEEIYRPQIDAERQDREETRSQRSERTRSRSASATEANGTGRSRSRSRGPRMSQ